ncbi:hypothetical protein SEPCBS119000_000081 [Sporothrix epigloea]|uniref:Zn(2)-C6 fungal-type domain-containing protein n=1 Tax=Sporothrix epigloea TaxID=1892477 RepID=A0ABP0D366_9PEZI
MSDVQDTPRIVRKRRRPAVVCAECRRRKIACDRKSPCGQCAVHNVDCVYVTGAAPPPYGRPLRQPTSPGSQPGVALPGERSDPVAGDMGVSDSAKRANASGSGDAPNTTGTATTSPLDEEEETLTGAEAVNTTASLGERSSRFGGRLAKTRLFGRTHWMNNMDEFKDIHSLTHLVHFVTGSVIYKSMRTCKSIARLIKADRAQKISAPARLGAAGQPLWLETVPPRAVSDRLVELYFNVFEPHFRILHMPTFRREYEAFMEDEAQRQTPGYVPKPKDVDLPPGKSDLPAHRVVCPGQGSATAEFMVKLILVLALGSCFYDGIPSDAAYAPNSSVASTSAAAYGAQLQDNLRIAAVRAIQRLDVFYCSPLSKHRLNLDTLKIYCLVTLARQTTALDLGDDLIWFTTGGLLHTAFGMGLNRDPSHFKSLSFTQCEIRRRLWATILELVVQSSLDQGMPPLISTDDYDCSPPSNLDDDEFGTDDEDGELKDSRPSDQMAADLRVHGGNRKRKAKNGVSVDMSIDGDDNSVPPRGDQSQRKSAVPRSGQPDTVFTHTSMQRLLYRSLPIRLRISKALNGLGLGLTYERALQLSSDLLEACRYLVTTLRAAPLMWSWMDTEAQATLDDNERKRTEQERAGFAKLRLAFYELLTRRFHHSLHSPFARKAGVNVQFFYSRRARIETVVRLMSFFRQPTAHAGMLADLDTPIISNDATATEHASGIPITLISPTAAEDPCRRLWLVGRGMLKCTMIDFETTAVIEMIHQLQEDYVPGSDLTLSQRELYDTMRTMIELSHARLEMGETNVKGYVFFRGALGQVDALMKGKPVRQAILESAQQAAAKTIGTLTNLASRRGIDIPADVSVDADGVKGNSEGGFDHTNKRQTYSAGDNGRDSVDASSISPVALQSGELRTVTVAGSATAGLAPSPATFNNALMSSGCNSYPGMYDTSDGAQRFRNLAGLSSASTSASTSGPSPSHVLGVSDMGMVTFNDLKRTTGRFGSGVVGMDSGIPAMSATDLSSNGDSTMNTSIVGGGLNAEEPWVDEWMMDPQGQFGFNNWFFPYNDRINNG